MHDNRVKDILLKDTIGEIRMEMRRATLAPRGRRAVRLLTVNLVFASLVLSSFLGPTGHAIAGSASSQPQEAREVRTVWTSEFGVPRPTGIAYVPERDELLVAGDQPASTSVLRLGFDESSLGTFRFPHVSSSATLAYQAAGDRLTAVSGANLIAAATRELDTDRPPTSRTDITDLGLRDPQGATFDPATGTWFILDGGAIAVVDAPAQGQPTLQTRISLADLGVGRFRGLAFDPSDGLLYVASSEQDLLYGLDASGTVLRTYSLASLDLHDLTAMTFAPSSDPTDDAEVMNLFIADAGSSSILGGVTEVTLTAAVAVAAPIVTATLVQTIATSAWNPGSPDPSGVVYLPGPDRLEVTDSEVDETTGAGYHGVNLWQIARSGTVTGTGTTLAYSSEPTGLGYDPGTNTLFISDDQKKRVWVVKPGSDARFGTSDDVVTWVDAGAYGSTDTEDPEFDPATGHLFFLDGIGTEVYDINPVNGVFGDGNDTMTHFDVGKFGPADWEGLGSDLASGDLLVGARKTKQIYEVTKSGSLVRIIDASGIPGMTYISGLAMAPASNGSGQMNYWTVDRAVDNGPDPRENDGKLFELSISTSTNHPPTVTNPGTMTNAVGDSIGYQIVASDPDGDAITSYGATGLPTGLSVDTGAGFISGTVTSSGTYSVTISATDSKGATGSTAFAWKVTAAPAITGFNPPSGPAGTSVTVNGSGFTGTTDVAFNGTSVGSGNFTVNSDAKITATVPSGATTGPISVTTPGGTATSSTDFTVIPVNTLTFGPNADTYDRSNRPTTNFGSKPSFSLDNSPVRHGLLRFTVSGVGTSAIQNVKLRLYCLDASDKGGDLYRVADNTWQEGTVTWNTEPPADTTPITSLGVVSANTWYEVDLTSLITGDGTYSLKILTPSSNSAGYSTKEGATGLAPQLVVTLVP